MKKAQATTVMIICLLVIIAVALIVIAYSFFSKSTMSGDIVKENNAEPPITNPEPTITKPECEQVKNDVDVQPSNILETNEGYLLELKVINKEDKILDLRIKGCVYLGKLENGIWRTIIETQTCNGGYGVLVKPQSSEDINISVLTDLKLEGGMIQNSTAIFYHGEVEGGDIYKTICS